MLMRSKYSTVLELERKILPHLEEYTSFDENDHSFYPHFVGDCRTSKPALDAPQLRVAMKDHMSAVDIPPSCFMERYFVRIVLTL